jgi:hypothetical protein
MKDWNILLLETIIRDNLFEQSKRLKTTISKVGSGSSLGQFKPTDTAFFNKLNKELPQKSDSEYNRIFLRFKSVAQGDERSESNDFRVDQIKNVLYNVVVKGSNYKALSGDPQIDSNEWIWFISDAFKTAEDDIAKSDDKGKSFYRVSGIRKDDVNQKDLVDKKGKPKWGTLSNGSAVFSEKQLSELVKIHQTPAPEPAVAKSQMIKAGDLTDGALLQKALYEYFTLSGVMDILSGEFKTDINKFKTTNFNASTGWNGNLNKETITVATYFQQLFSDVHSFTVDDEDIVEIDGKFREALATEWNNLPTAARVQESVVISEQDISKLKRVKTNEKGELSAKSSDQTTTDTDKTTTSTGKKKSSGSTSTDKKKSSGSTVTVKDSDNISSAEREKLTNWKTTPVAKNFKLGKTYLVGNWIVQRIWLKEYPEYKIEKSYGGGEKYIPYPLRVLNSQDLSKRYIVYGYTKKSNGSTVFDMEISEIVYNKQQIPSKLENIVYHPKWYREKAIAHSAFGSSKFQDLKPYFISEQSADEWSPRSTTHLVFNADDFKYKKLSKTQKIVGKLYAGSAGAMTYEDTYKAGIDSIKSWNELVAVIKYMDQMAAQKNKGGWWIPGNINFDTLLKEHFKGSWSSMLSEISNAGYKDMDAGAGSLGTGYYNKSEWGGRWLDYINDSVMYTPGTIRYQGNSWPINSFINQFYGEFWGEESVYLSTYNHILKIAGDDQLDFMPGEIGWQNTEHKIYLVKPEIRDSKSFSRE